MSLVDTDHNGRISRKEADAAKKADFKSKLSAESKALLEKYDANGDGRLDPAEIHAVEIKAAKPAKPKDEPKK